MKKVFIVHGFGGIPNAGWIPWLMEELAKKGVYTCALPMPQSKKPVVSKWVEEIAHAINNAPEDEIYLVGHSLGVAAIFRYFENIHEGKKISGAVLMSGFTSPLDPENPSSVYREIDSFTVPGIDLEKIRNKALKFVVFHSTNDPVVPFSHALKISNALDCKLVQVEKGGHFFILAEPICYEIPELLEILNEVLK